jgi:flagellar assembly protein FliH
MLCRVHRGDSPIEPVTWPTPDGSSLALALHQQHDKAVSRTSSDTLERRIAELESQAENQARDAYRAGLEEGRKAATAELEPAIQKLANSLQELSRVKARLRKEAESDLVKLTIAVAKRILRRELTVDPEALKGVIAAALERVALRELARVRVHPSHESLVRSHLSSAAGSAIEVVADTSLQAGDILFESSRGTVDASIDSQLREIERGFTDAFNG